MIRWVRDPEFNGGCCGHHKRPRLATDAELAEEYRDLCHCCLEKEECKTSDECKRDPNSEESVSLQVYIALLPSAIVAELIVYYFCTC